MLIHKLKDGIETFCGKTVEEVATNGKGKAKHYWTGVTCPDCCALRRKGATAQNLARKLAEVKLEKAARRAQEKELKAQKKAKVKAKKTEDIPEWTDEQWDEFDKINERFRKKREQIKESGEPVHYIRSRFKQSKEPLQTMCRILLDAKALDDGTSDVATYKYFRGTICKECKDVKKILNSYNEGPA